MPPPVQRSAEFEAIGEWPLRMTLTRVWSAGLPLAAVCMCNPSDAGEDREDPTSHAVTRLLRDLPGLGGWIGVNWSPYITAHPSALYRWREAAAIGSPDSFARVERRNLDVVAAVSARAAVRFVAWGNLVPDCPSVAGILAALSGGGAHDLYAFGLTKDGRPKHPLARGQHRIAAGSPVLWRAAVPDFMR